VYVGNLGEKHLKKIVFVLKHFVSDLAKSGLKAMINPRSADFKVLRKVSTICLH